eukprot:Plantae.Rhodophyta-Purpureofilum_apyrenoidigerum.ctg7225.p1 GENE.Plantae.Rhodophyta-Purpureofilum_apyrenoidigerum.ctg7225~~Plantae.Rhodophyta-Purpureofilum_apyrenoidigerum.ctg7225.p1  ORF type:complete len:131 (+),score=17.53 Plantae.Rhodophyta-Purpureofilum_apyrenoidigerum.ctg7225:629-1021(+)
MNDAVRSLPGDNCNFTAFRKVDCSSSSPLVSIKSAQVVRRKPAIVEVEVKADRFLYGMMRLLSASLVDVGTGKLSVCEFHNLLTAEDRSLVKTSAPAKGLCLLRVEYPSNLAPFPDETLQHFPLGMSDVD